MRLQEEYFKRHGLNILPIYHTNNSNLIFKVGKNTHIILSIKFEETRTTPGFYTFNYLRPNHNAYFNGNYFSNTIVKSIYQYDEYTNSIIKLTEGINKMGLSLINLQEIKLVVWEMFVYCFDSWFVEQELEDEVYTTVNSLLSIFDRETAVDNFLNNHSAIKSDVYDELFKPLENNYAIWLAELINSHIKVDKNETDAICTN